MRIEYLGKKGTWREIADSARTTINKEGGNGEPSSSWKRRILLSEHSPIRQLIIKAKWYDLKYWVSVHLVRHWLGIVHFIGTQRTDRTGVDRDESLQSALVTHEIEANAQAIINISRKRMCMQASKETREAWCEFVSKAVFREEPELASCCVPDCIYRGWCYEYKSCGYHNTEEFKTRLEQYRKDINA
jgi:hypothetical protein